ncbi:hypothetical protein FL814_07805 [Salmonella enterica subsp. enterica]|nr:hypothetical protein [Salmonella enterica subsp. enterica serovar Oslo]
MNIQRFSDESTRLKSRNDQSELWDAMNCSPSRQPEDKHLASHHQSSSGGLYDTQNNFQWLSSRSSSRAPCSASECGNGKLRSNAPPYS